MSATNTSLEEQGKCLQSCSFRKLRQIPLTEENFEFTRALIPERNRKTEHLTTSTLD